MDDLQRLDRLARYVASTVLPNATIGLGSGSTAEAVVRALGERVREGLAISGVPTSRRTADLAASCGINLLDFSEVETLDLGIDGADEISPQLDLVKGKGGALLYEKLVALACKRFLVVASSEKLVERLGTRLPLPVEIVPFGSEKTAVRVRALGLEPTLRCSFQGAPFVTDGGHYILDCKTGPIEAPAKLAQILNSTPGVVDHGLFISIADEAIVINKIGQLISVTAGAQTLLSDS
jgi:ribose 5-phosphate isomerase A